MIKTYRDLYSFLLKAYINDDGYIYPKYSDIHPLDAIHVDNLDIKHLTISICERKRDSREWQTVFGIKFEKDKVYLSDKNLTFELSFGDTIIKPYQTYFKIYA